MSVRRRVLFEAVREKGFSLLEVLISLVVVSVGLLGLAALQMASLKNLQHSYHVAVANLAAKNAKETLWASMLYPLVIEHDGASRSVTPVCPSRPGEITYETDYKANEDRVGYDDSDNWIFSPGELQEILGISVIIEQSLVDFCGYVVKVSWDSVVEDQGETVLAYPVKLPGLSFEEAVGVGFGS